MSPVDFNPNNKAVGIGHSLTDGKPEATDNKPTENTSSQSDTDSVSLTLSEDAKLLNSDLLEIFNNSPAHAAFEARQAEKVASLKSQVQSGTHPLQSNDPSQRREATTAVANKLADFESHFSVLDE